MIDNVRLRVRSSFGLGWGVLIVLSSMDIKILQKKRQKNVQEQNKLEKYYMREHSIGFRENPEEYNSRLIEVEMWNMSTF
ncbi:hypothetical protein [Zooshikella ganghwensis]|uniref:Uncharacterized protein n=1 Tax=Zooshikella ganghwensis TaxID=202772 RepID=A0A4P9VQ48_9GAMM|nr:hypothetical protein [Zooshikella ganghwensis]RDH45126.1 hypothetical protein B9G39_17710 [Zooshikella ganghwensis]